MKDRAAAFIAFRTARIPPLSDAAHVPSHGNLTKTFDFDPQKDARRELLVAAAQAWATGPTPWGWGSSWA